jgi:hypothetical protein
MNTVRIAAPITDENQNGFVVINTSDFDPAVHEPFSSEDLEQLRAAPLTDLKPSLVVGAQEALAERHAELEAEAARQREQADVLEAERKRLADLSAQLEASAKAQADAIAAAAAAAKTETAPAKGAKKAAE